MKLSEAIRLGAMIHPQVTGKMFKWEGYPGTVTKTCALGAAYVAALGTPISEKFSVDNGYNTLYREYPILHRLISHPFRNKIMSLGCIIQELNDNQFKLTREKIADWVETIELEQELNQTQPLVVEEAVKI